MTAPRGAKPSILLLLERLNVARYKGDKALAAELDAELEAADRRRGWTRTGGFNRDTREPPARITKSPRWTPS